jgi:hypothetical protein
LNVTTIAGVGNLLAPTRPIALSGSVPGISPNLSCTNTPPT